MVAPPLLFSLLTLTGFLERLGPEGYTPLVAALILAFLGKGPWSGGISREFGALGAASALASLIMAGIPLPPGYFVLYYLTPSLLPLTLLLGIRLGLVVRYALWLALPAHGEIKRRTVVFRRLPGNFRLALTELWQVIITKPLPLHVTLLWPLELEERVVDAERVHYLATIIWYVGTGVSPVLQVYRREEQAQRVSA